LTLKMPINTDPGYTAIAWVPFVASGSGTGAFLITQLGGM